MKSITENVTYSLYYNIYIYTNIHLQMLTTVNIFTMLNLTRASEMTRLFPITINVQKKTTKIQIMFYFDMESLVISTLKIHSGNDKLINLYRTILIMRT